jgi:pumilio family protein 6
MPAEVSDLLEISSTDIEWYKKGKAAAMDALLEPLTSPYPAEDASRPFPIDLPHTSRMYKTLLQGGHFSREDNCIVPSSSFSASSFASAFLKTVGRETTVEIAKGNGAFLVAELCGRILEEGSVGEKNTLNNWFGNAVKNDIFESQGKGRKVLLEKLNELALA